MRTYSTDAKRHFLNTENVLENSFDNTNCWVDRDEEGEQYKIAREKCCLHCKLFARAIYSNKLTVWVAVEWPTKIPDIHIIALFFVLRSIDRNGEKWENDFNSISAVIIELLLAEASWSKRCHRSNHKLSTCREFCQSCNCKFAFEKKKQTNYEV